LRWYWLIAPALLICIAGQQVFLSQVHHLSPWSGGGFGMFSSLDSGYRRTLEANIEYDGIRQQQPLPKQLNDTVLDTITLPTPNNLDRLAYKLSHQLNSSMTPPYKITLSVWRTRYSPKDLQLQDEILISRTIEITESAPSGEHFLP
jgi:hypothetical protein